MTKYEWEKELKNNLKRVPEQEVARILDYYNELFDDKIEQGMSEKEIVRTFGNPFDVAYRVIYETEAGGKTLSPQEEPEPVKPYIPVRPEPVKPYTPVRPEPVKPYVPEKYAPVKPYTPAYTPERSETAETRENRSGGNGGRIFARFIFFLPYMILMIVMWSLVVSFAAAGISSVAAGIVAAFSGLFLFSASAGTAIATVGTGLAATGIGLMISALAYVFVKAAVKITQKYFFMAKHKANQR